MNNGLAPRKKGYILEEALKKLGREATYEKVLEITEPQGYHPNEEAFTSMRDKLLHLENLAKVGNEIIFEEQLYTATLGSFVKFCIAVEACGGINQAQKYLDALKSLGRTFNGTGNKGGSHQ